MDSDDSWDGKKRPWPKNATKAEKKKAVVKELKKIMSTVGKNRFKVDLYKPEEPKKQNGVEVGKDVPCSSSSIYKKSGNPPTTRKLLSDSDSDSDSDEDFTPKKKTEKKDEKNKEKKKSTYKSNGAEENKDIPCSSSSIYKKPGNPPTTRKLLSDSDSDEDFTPKKKNTEEKNKKDKKEKKSSYDSNGAEKNKDIPCSSSSIYKKPGNSTATRKLLSDSDSDEDFTPKKKNIEKKKKSSHKSNGADKNKDIPGCSSAPIKKVIKTEPIFDFGLGDIDIKPNKQAIDEKMKKAAAKSKTNGSGVKQEVPDRDLWVVEKITDIRLSEGRLIAEFETHFVGGTVSWEPAESFQGGLNGPMIREFKKKNLYWYKEVMRRDRSEYWRKKEEKERRILERTVKQEKEKTPEKSSEESEDDVEEEEEEENEEDEEDQEIDEEELEDEEMTEDSRVSEEESEWEIDYDAIEVDDD